MFINKAHNNRNNYAGVQISELRKAHSWSQRELAEQLQLLGLEFTKNSVQRIESGKRFVTDVELLTISRLFNVSCDVLIGNIQS